MGINKQQQQLLDRQRKAISKHKYWLTNCVDQRIAEEATQVSRKGGKK